MAGSAVATVFWWLKFGKPDVTMACNGMLAGLVAITAPCAFVSSTSAVVIGGIAGMYAFTATFVVFTVVNKVRSIRVKPEDEREGLDEPEFGMLAYPEDVISVEAEA